jgi:hypothetical protein
LTLQIFKKGSIQSDLNWFWVFTLLAILAVVGPVNAQAISTDANPAPNEYYSLQLLANNLKRKPGRAPKTRRQPKERGAADRIATEREPSMDKEARASGPIPKMSVEANPLGLLFGAYNLELNLKFSDRMTAGAVGSYANYGFLSAFGVGGNIYYYKDKLFQDWFATGGFVYGQGQGSTLGYSYKLTTINLYGMGGYKWLWPSFMLSLGAGLQVMQSSYSATYSGELDELNLESAPTPSINASGLAVMFNIGIPIY